MDKRPASDALRPFLTRQKSYSIKDSKNKEKKKWTSIKKRNDEERKREILREIERNVSGLQ